MPLGDFEIQMVTLGNAMNYDGVLADMAADAFTLVRQTDTVLTYSDGQGRTIRLGGDFASLDHVLISTFGVFDNGARTASIHVQDYSFTGVVGLLPFLEQQARDATGGMALRGGVGTDKLTGSAAGDLLDGRGGRDHLFGSAGNDTVLGGSGNDVLKGGAGIDVLRGGAGNNRMTGGTNKDGFVIDIDGASAGHVVVTDFQDGADIILLHFDALPDGFEFGTLDELVDGTTLADADEADLLALGLTVRETASGSTVISSESGEVILQGMAKGIARIADILVSSLSEVPAIEAWFTEVSGLG